MSSNLNMDDRHAAQTLCAATVYAPKKWDNGNGPGHMWKCIRDLTRSSELTREGLAVEPTQPQPIKPIETRYAGCRFRSRVEARWAVFFDHLSIKWEYEPEGYDLPSGYYLPDFFLPDIGEQGVWFEVKPDSASVSEEDPRWGDLARITSRPVYITHGIPRPGNQWGVLQTNQIDQVTWDEVWYWKDASDLDNLGEKIYESFVGWDTSYAFCFCYICDKIGLQFSGANERICPHGDRDRVRHWEPDDPRVVAAYTAARSARFEHGEAG